MSTEPIAAHVPWAMQVVVRVEKNAPPAHTSVLRATASAVAVALSAFTAPDADPDVRERTEHWRAGPIRKVVRRARGAGWDRQLAVAGAFRHRTCDVDVAVHVPGPVDQVDPEISRLQVGGLNLEDGDDGCPAAGSGVVLWLNPRLTLTTGKAAAQAGHAAQLVLQAGSADATAAWVAAGAPVDVAVAGEADWDRLVATLPVVVRDGGFTEVSPGTVTVVAEHPWA